jgi:hypothetical protein
MTNCISCGMPLEPDTTSKQDNQYCIYCQNQDTGKLKTYEEVRLGSINAAVRLMGKSMSEATVMADQMLPTLPRWQKENATTSSK